MTGTPQTARDMSGTDWRGLLRGLFKFLSEEAREPEHAEDVPALATAPNSGVPQAASVMFVSPTRDILFVKRSKKEKNWPDTWAFPGGKVDDGETAEDCARRETREEVGYNSEEPLEVIDEKDTDRGWHHTTYLCNVAEPFDPKLNDEHSAFAWAPFGEWPQPLHPGVEATLAKLGHATDGSMSELGTALRGPGAMARQVPKNPIGKDGFIKITHQIDETPETVETNRGTPDVERMSREVRRDKSDHSVRKTGTAFDVRMAEDRAVLAFDRESVREKDVDGRMRVSIANISKANICPYIGKEIPGWRELGLDPDKRYDLLRDPEELSRAAPSFNNLPILSKHQPVDAVSHPPELVIGATGTDAEFGSPYLTNSLAFWPKAAIDSIENDEMRQLSAAYRYDADMTPGTYEGKHYDGVMRNIVGNHVALVREGRAGPDVVVGDEMPRGWAAPRWRTVMARPWSGSPWSPAMAVDAALAMDPLTDKGEKIMENMKDRYGSEKGERVFYASRNKGTIKGVDSMGGVAARKFPAHDVGAESIVNGKRTGYKISTDAESGYGPGKNPASHRQGTVAKSGSGSAGKIDLIHGIDLPDKTRGGRSVMRSNQSAVRVTSPEGKVSHTYFGSSDKPHSRRQAEGHFKFMTYPPGSQHHDVKVHAKDADFEESKHPRDHGKFTSGGGSSGGAPVRGKRAEATHGSLVKHGFKHEGEMGGATGEGWHLYSHPSGGYMHVNHETGAYRGYSPKRSSLPSGSGSKAIARHLENNYPGGSWKTWDGSGPEYWNSRK